jgi:LPS sulfotransferase NodH
MQIDILDRPATRALFPPLVSFPHTMREAHSPERRQIEAYFKRFPVRPISPTALGPFLGICFVNRSGSNLLASVLASTGHFNEAGEVFLPSEMLDMAEAAGMTAMDEYMMWLRQHFAKERRLTAKLGLWQLAMLVEAGLLGRDGRYVLLDRRDRLRQAISMAIAFQNQQWTSLHEKRLADEELVYSRRVVDGALASIDSAMIEFEMAFDFMNVRPHRVFYEDLAGDPQFVVDRLGAWMGMPGLTVELDQVKLERQSAAINEDWRARYVTGW